MSRVSSPPTRAWIIGEWTRLPPPTSKTPGRSRISPSGVALIPAGYGAARGRRRHRVPGGGGSGRQGVDEPDAVDDIGGPRAVGVEDLEDDGGAVDLGDEDRVRRSDRQAEVAVR